ncbi:hypothetical protein [Dactylosporangium sp. NPDC051541]|uniref:hypothetical protein n=1 Tax=Dactylosporangium sp. NPDC051541 TaxID=3363977 RepID=UPI0037A4F261
MQPNVPFRLIEVLGTSRVGKVWAGMDPAGRQLTVAVLDAGAAADPRWRGAFESAARATTQPHGGPMPVIGADFAAPAPWVAMLADGGPGAVRVFQTLGVEWIPAAPAGPPAPVPADQASRWATGPQPLVPAPPPVSPPPVSAPPVSAPPVVPAADRPTEVLPAFPPPIPALPLPPGYQAPVSGAAGYPPVSGPPGYQPPVSGAGVYPPVSGAAGYPPVSGAAGYPPVSGPPGYQPERPVSAQPQRQPWDDQGPSAFGDESPYPPLGDVNAPRPRGRMWAVIAAVAVLVVLVGGGTVLWLTVFKDGGTTPVAQPSTQSSAQPSLSPPMVATPSPGQPGLEPPRVGDWPKWPVFDAGTNPKPKALNGTGLTIAVPSYWICTQAGAAEGTTRYTCGATNSKGDEVGGEIIVRTCAAPCDAEGRDRMRKVEEAWGQQWRYAGDSAFLAETKTVNGGDRYGLVVVAFWPSTAGGAVDREVVLRMTAPGTWTDEIRKVANATKDAAKF